MSDEQEDTTYTLLSDEDRSKVKQRLLAAHEHLFHGTPAADLDSIRQNGLHPRFESVHSAYANMADDPFTTSLISKMPFWRRKSGAGDTRGSATAGIRSRLDLGRAFALCRKSIQHARMATRLSRSGRCGRADIGVYFLRQFS
jgi:hypothetical protein